MPAILVARYAGTLPLSTLWRSSPAISSSEPGEPGRDMQRALKSLKGWDPTTFHPHRKAKKLIGSPESLSPAKAMNEWGWETMSIYHVFFGCDRVYTQKGTWYNIVQKNKWWISIHSSDLSMKLSWDALAVARWYDLFSEPQLLQFEAVYL